jgi:hypothetical protein
MHLTLELTAEQGNQLSELASKNGTDLGNYAKERLFPPKPKAMPWSDKEVILFQKINRSFSSNFLKKLKELKKKRFDETMNDIEQQEYLSLLNLLEEANVVRLEALIELASIRNTSLDGIMSDLNIPSKN